MFKLNPDPTFVAKVQITTPAGPAAVLDITFRHKGKTAFAAFGSAAIGKAHSEVLADVIVDWNGPLDDAGNPVAYTPAALAQLLDNYPPAGEEILNAYGRALMESRAKN